MKPHTVTIAQRSGECRWCGCTERDPCAAGCGWANQDRTLCTDCLGINKAMQTTRGRHDLINAFKEALDADAVLQ